MLSLIRVKNYAVIDEIELEFARGFNVMTGETGAGKSILVDALGLALGDRADATAVRAGRGARGDQRVSSTCSAEPRGRSLGSPSAGSTTTTSCTLRRVIGSDGRSRAFINGQPVNLQDLKTLGGLLVDIHGQHAHQSLLEAGNQRALLDAHDGIAPLASRVAERFAAWQRCSSRSRELAASSSARPRSRSSSCCASNSPSSKRSRPSRASPSGLRAERDRLANTDRLLSGVSARARRLVRERNRRRLLRRGPRAPRAREARRRTIPTLRSPPRALGEHRNRAARGRVDVATLPRAHRGRSRAPRVGSTTGSRKFRTLARRHGVRRGRPRRGARNRCARALAALDGGGESLEALERKSRRARARLFRGCARSSRPGARSMPTKLGRAVSSQLAELGMPHGEFRVELEPKPDERADAHAARARRVPGEAESRPAVRAAGEGRLRRRALAHQPGDRGGALGRVAGSRRSCSTRSTPASAAASPTSSAASCAQLRRRRQVLCVTHLPQVASHGEAHYRVVKLTDGKTSRTNVRSLTSRGTRRRVVADARRRRGHGAHARARGGNDRPSRPK